MVIAAGQPGVDDSGAPTRRYRFELTGPGSSTKDIVVQGEACHMGPPEDSPVVATFRCDSSTFVLLMCGRMTAGKAFSEGLLAVEGGQNVVEGFARWFGGSQN